MKRTDNYTEFMTWFKYQSEKYFAELELDKTVYGFQHQKGTKWKKGLTDQELDSFQKEMGFEFPEELKEFYKLMNGTNLPGVNVYGEQGDPYYYEPIYFSFPEHLFKIKELINERLSIKGITIDYMRENNIPFIFPITDHYFIVIDNQTNPIFYISIGYKNHDLNKPVLYSSLWTDTLESWLIKDTFNRTNHISDLEEFPNKKRISNYWSI